MYPLVLALAIHSKEGFFVRLLALSSRLRVVGIPLEAQDALRPYRKKLFNAVNGEERKRHHDRIRHCERILLGIFQNLKSMTNAELVAMYARCAEDNFLKHFVVNRQLQGTILFSVWSDLYNGNRWIFPPCRFCRVHFLADICGVLPTSVNIMIRNNNLFLYANTGSVRLMHGDRQVKQIIFAFNRENAAGGWNFVRYQHRF
jgi:hypothetical protein